MAIESSRTQTIVTSFGSHVFSGTASLGALGLWLPSTLGLCLRLYLSEALTITDSGEYRHFHDCARAGPGCLLGFFVALIARAGRGQTRLQVLKSTLSACAL